MFTQVGDVHMYVSDEDMYTYTYIYIYIYVCVCMTFLHILIFELFHIEILHSPVYRNLS